MAKSKKPVDVQKKQANVKNKSAVIPMKKQKNKKNKKAGDENTAIKSTILTATQNNVTDGQETSGSSPAKKKKKEKNVIVDVAVVNEVLSNPNIMKNISKKKIVETGGEAESPNKTKKKKVTGRKDGNVKGAIQKVQIKSDKKRTPPTIADEEVENVTEVEPKPGQKRKKSKASSGADEQETEGSPKNQKSEKTNDETENDGGVELKSVKKRKTKKASSGDDEPEADTSPKKQKSKKTNYATTDEAAADKTPSISVFVGNLPVNTKRDKILKLFSKFGKVKSIRFRLSNGVKFFKSQSKVTSPNVIAFVDYDLLEDAKASLVLNREKIKDNVIRVNLQSKAKSADSFDGKRTVFVGNLKYSITDQNLHDLFSCCGDIEYARTMQCDKGCNGIGYVCFKKSESIGMALELNNADLQGRPVRVQRYVKKTDGGPKEKKNKKEKPTGAVRRLGKKQKANGPGKGKESNAKKSFTGTKAKDKKKSFVKKTKKPLKGPKLLAKKIASRDKTTKATA